MDIDSHVRLFFEKYPGGLDDEEIRRVVLKANRLMDVAGAGPDGHPHRWRKFFHHREGIEYVRSVYGGIGSMAATQHVLDDCGSIHSVLDYYNGILDENGMVR